MKKDAVKDIQELIEYLLRIRERELAENEANAHLINAYPQNNYDLAKENAETMERFDERLITLNNLLKEKERNQAVLEIEKLQAKKYLSPKELAELYPDMSISSQATYRGRIHDKLPYHQKKKNGKIMYIIKEVEQWRENQYK